ncbi:type II secretion system minor pseudopilin GspK [Endozoicomonas sp. SM1973]|uniref:Type II secretion system protein K n=1 Tax=Spartinivicinus marinus TaxID=2994442 RepID=A0A853IJ28_9GAMM|nr:type II secretion system minor pseudopilin GspK [Spartinivicinus marinus]MCX4024954.1 type II secretion system minor pseudopilin GspK [Spartinivicinus marinus]NYZ67646.1 type II secretion system minor pseudopilin GspK [Spartinivicinus marinus]
MSYKQLNKQTGVALIFIMVIFSLVTVLAAKIVTNIRLETERTSHLLMRQQAKQYAYSAEQLVAELLRADKENDERNKAVKDHYFEAWHYQQEELKIDTGDIGKIEIDVFDLQGFINLNSLAATGTTNNGQPPGGNPPNNSGGNNPRDNTNNKGDSLDSKAVLQRLLSLQGIEADKARQIISQITDWVDSNQQVSAGGAEDDDYLLGDNPYRTANDQMASVSELMLLANMDYKIYRKLAPFVTVIPAVSGDTKINVNTAPVEVFQAMISGLDKRSAEAIIKARGKEGFKEAKDFEELGVLTGKQIPKGSIDIKSDYFKAVIKTKFADAEYYLVSYFHRSPKQGVSVISRQEGQPLIRLAKPKVKKD